MHWQKIEAVYIYKKQISTEHKQRYMLLQRKWACINLLKIFVYLQYNCETVGKS